MQTTTARAKKTSKTATQDHLTDTSTLSAVEREKVDAFVTMSAEVAALKPLLDKFEKAKKELASIANDDDRFPDKETAVVLSGNSGEIEFSPASNSREISDKNGLIGALKAKLGYDGLIALIKVTLGDMDKYLSEAESAAFIKSVFGSRSLKSAHTK